MPPIPARIGPYEIVRRLSQGGMGVLYLGKDPRIGRSVAIKVLHVHSDEVRVRFLREARTAGGLQHPNIVTIYDVGEYDEQPYIAMEYIDGHTLAELIRQRADLSMPRRLELIEALCDGLAYAHQRGVVHRDVKPANVMVSQHGLLKILDFGIARVVDSGLTQVGLVIGTPNYMSPEQVEGLEVDRRSDVFSVGLVLYELLSFKQAFPGETPHAVSFHILSREPAPLDRLVPTIDRALCEIVDRALCKTRDARYQDLSTMRTDVSRVRRRLAATTEETLVAPRPRSDSRPVVDREGLARRRRVQVQMHVELAQTAAAEGRLDDAIEACEQALTLDPDESRALALLHDIRERLNQVQLHALLDEAKQALGRQALTEARNKLEEASLLAPGATEIADIERDLHRALEHRRSLAREEEYESALTNARTTFAENAFEASLHFAREALGFKADSTEARHLAAQAETALRDLRSRQAWEREAQDLVRSCHQQFAAGYHRQAVASLEAFAPPHPLVTEALDTLRPRLHQIEAQTRREAEARTRAQWLESQIASARALLGRDDASGAIAILEPLAHESATAHTLYDEARRRVELQRLHSEVASLISQADTLERNTNLEGALKLLEQARDRLPHDDAVTLRLRRVQIARDEQRRRQAIEATLDQARETFATGRWDDAIALLEGASPSDDRIRRELATLSLERTRRIEAQRRQQADDQTRSLIAAARAEFQAGDRDQALQRLRAAPAHPEIHRAVRELESAANAIRREEEEREAQRRVQALDAAAGQIIAAARLEIDAGRLAEAHQLLTGSANTHPAIAEELAALSRLVAERELDATAQRALEHVLELLEDLDLPGAEAVLAEIARIAPDHTAVAAAESAIDEMRGPYAEQQARKRQLGAAADAICSADFERASGLIEQVAAQTGEDDSLRALRRRLSESRTEFNRQVAVETHLLTAMRSLAEGDTSKSLGCVRAALDSDSADRTLARLERAILDLIDRETERIGRLEATSHSHAHMLQIEQAAMRDDADEVLNLLRSDQTLPDEGVALRRDFESSGPTVTQLDEEAASARRTSQARVQRVFEQASVDNTSTQERLLARVDVGLERGHLTDVFAALQALQARDPDTSGLSTLVARACEALAENRFKVERERAILESALDWAERSCARGQFLEAMTRLRSLEHIPAAKSAIDRLTTRYGPFARAAGSVAGDDVPVPTPPPSLRTPTPSGRVPAARPTPASSGDPRATAEPPGLTTPTPSGRVPVARPTTASSGDPRAIAESAGRTLAAVREKLKTAQALADAGKLAEAEQAATAALALDSRNADVLAFLDDLLRRDSGRDGTTVKPSR